MAVHFKHRLIIALKYSFYLCLTVFLIISCGSTAQPSAYESYSVQKGETVASIARDRGISESMIYNLNPDSRKGIKTNSVIILPIYGTTTKGAASGKEGFVEHKVKPKETIFGIARDYNLSVDELKEANPDLKTRGLRKGEVIAIPLPKGDQSITKVPDDKKGSETKKNNVPPGTKEHVIQPKETKYGVARQYGITIAELEDLNPHIKSDFPIGETILIPTKEVVKQGEVDTDNFELYEVKAKEGFYRLKVKFGLSEEEIIALNPYAKDGLREGMILKIPKNGYTSTKKEEVKVVDLEKKIDNKRTKNLALMLPFRLATNDSVSDNEDIIKKDPTLRVALDFYSGAIMAAEFAKEKGISINLNVYDTGQNEAKVGSILNSNNFENSDAVIGPLLQKNVEQTAAALAKNDIPVFSPLSNRELDMSPNLFQSLPTTAVLQQTLINFLKRNASGKNIIFLTDTKHQKQSEMFSAALPSTKIVVTKNNYIRDTDVLPQLDNNRDNWIIFASDKPILVSSVVNVLGSLATSNKIRLFTMDKNEAYEWHEVSNNKLAKLEFTFPSVNKNSDEEEKTDFFKKYKSKYGVWPNRYVTRGFDVTYDVILRLAAEKDIYDTVKSGSETVYIENKFRYEPNGKNGYSNKAAYILKYNDDLKFEVVE